ncbi:fluoride efflux transporter FluC [Mycetocola zhadangensis]|uniref:Fluoride-specific ion channel FluC n=1 Tax=Mycetocola zhadangensis TaxID=1164595 RepID=A0A3L7J1V0_9MICO|nr:CrcB family protein [Mycetocola zhadangensis]RLQ84523.1 CrcB family protein [Mycetocola zhadangensis]GGE92240.1 putative fluoride ion transporter CrcB 2 [Mycetocola zhadangensis]
MLMRLAAVFVGGLVGTALRWAADALLASPNDAFPYSTLLVNVIGSFVLALLVGSVWVRPAVPDWLRAGLGAGVLGSFTTFSALASAVVVQLASEQFALAAVHLAASLVLGLGAAFVGIRLGHHFGRGVEPSDWTTE